MRSWLGWLLACCAVLLAVPAAADEIRPAVVELSEQEPGEWLLDWKLPIASADQAAGPVPALVIPESCAFIEGPVLRAAPLAQLGHGRLQCEGSLADQRIGFGALPSGSDALLRVVPIGQASQTSRLTSDMPSVLIAAAPTTWSVARSYFAIGVEHILLGWDHLLFVIALVLLVRGGWSIVKAATAFTIAHSVTLVATTLGYAGLPQRPVEALIALSILFLAVELHGRGQPDRPKSWTQRAPWLVALGFGLLHGFGFAGALSEIGLPAGEVPAALLAFNIGVEAGQLLVIAVVLCLRWLVLRWAPQAWPIALKLITYAIGTIASFWLFERLLT